HPAATYNAPALGIAKDRPRRGVMRRCLACGVCLFVLTSAFAGPLPPRPAEPAADRARLHLEAEEFARQLYYTLAQVAEQYVRPLGGDQLRGAALRGLYEAARVPVPAGLDADVKRAETDADQVTLLARVREELGDAEPVRGSEAMRAACQGLK